MERRNEARERPARNPSPPAPSPSPEDRADGPGRERPLPRLRVRWVVVMGSGLAAYGVGQALEGPVSGIALAATVAVTLHTLLE